MWLLKFTIYFIIIFIIINYLLPLKKLIIPSQLIATIGKMIYKDFPLNLLFCKFYYKKLRLYKVDNWHVIGGCLSVSQILNNAKVSWTIDFKLFKYFNSILFLIWNMIVNIYLDSYLITICISICSNMLSVT